MPYFATRYTFEPASDEARSHHLSAHVAWLQRGVDSGFIVTSGAWADGTGALIVASHDGTADEVRARFHEDPFVAHALVGSVVVDEWTPAIGAFA